MATYVEGIPARGSELSWSGIFAGTFVFLAIEVTFGMLGAAIFATATSPNSANPVRPGVSAGFGIWMVVLSIIAMYFGSKAAGRLSNSVARSSGTYIGLVTFGMSVFASILIVAMTVSSATAGAAVQANATARSVVDVVTTGGYWLFVTLLLAMIAAVSGGRHGVKTDSAVVKTLDRSQGPDLRRVA
jgi:hypothetical protein